MRGNQTRNSVTFVKYSLKPSPATEKRDDRPKPAYRKALHVCFSQQAPSHGKFIKPLHIYGITRSRESSYGFGCMRDTQTKKLL